MEIRSTEEVKEKVLEFVTRLLNLEEEKKKLADDVKALKQEYKEDGVAVGVVVSAINQIKADKKKNDAEKFELATIKEWIETSVEADNQIGALTAK